MKKKVIWAVLAFWLTQTAQAQQIPGMGFDTWSRTGGSWYPYAKEAPAAERVWDSANKGLSLLGVNTTTPEYDHVAVSGKGKAAAKVVSKKVLWAFVAGNLFTGRFNKVVDLASRAMSITSRNPSITPRNRTWTGKAGRMSAGSR